MSYPDKAEVMRAADLYAEARIADRAVKYHKDDLEAKLDQLYAALDARKGAQIVYSPDAKAMSDRVKALEAALAEAQKDARFKCRVPGCCNAALDQLPSEQPSVCAAHDPGR